MRRRNVAFVALIVVLFAASAAAAGGSDKSVEFNGRTIDLRPHIEGFPYEHFTAYYDAGKLYYYHRGETTSLMELALSGNVDLRKGHAISDLDYSTRNVWEIRYRKNDGKLYWSGDERNDEIINLFRLDPSTGEITRLTDVPYVFGWLWDPDKKTVAYVARLGDKDRRQGELRLLDLDSGREQTILRDDPGHRFTWGTPSWRPGGRGVVVPVLKNADRAFANLAYVDFDEGTLRLVTDPTRRRNWPAACEEWLGPDELLYFSNEDGFENAYRHDVVSGETVKVTSFDRDIQDAELVEVDGRKLLFVVLSNPIENELILVDPESGEIEQRQTVDVSVSILDVAKDRLLVSSESAVVKFRIDEITVTPDRFVFAARVEVPADLKEKIVHADVERVEYPTFDLDPNTGKSRMLHAFLYRPQKPLPPDEAIVMIQSFYGGGNEFSTRTQILAEAGIYVFSPSPRGSAGFGREFSSLNDKDLGGNEIIDVIYAAKYVSQKLSIPPERVGVYGGSHGGYATMRLLTFPGEINGNKASFDWGFGISHAGFSDIAHFYQHCNIPDWVILEAGDPRTESDKLRDRSPLYHADKMHGKLLLTHGTNDSRVPIEGSRWMADSLRAHGKDVTLVEFEGQGHGIKGLENYVTYYNVWFDFLESLQEDTGGSGL